MWVLLWLRWRCATRDGVLEFERRREVEVVDVFEIPEVAAADRIIATPGFGVVAPAERVIGDLDVTESGMRLLGPIRGVRGILAGLAEVTPEANGAEGGHPDGRA